MYVIKQRLTDLRDPMLLSRVTLMKDWDGAPLRFIHQEHANEHMLRYRTRAEVPVPEAIFKFEYWVEEE